MLTRNVEFKLDGATGAITPSMPQYGGVRGEHNASRLVITVANGTITQEDIVRLSFLLGDGSTVSSDILDVTIDGARATVSFPLAQLLTQTAGQLCVRLVVSHMDDNGEEIVTWRSDEMILWFEDAALENGTPFWTGVSELLHRTAKAKAEAVAVAETVEQGKADAKRFAEEAAASARLAAEEIQKGMRYRGAMTGASAESLSDQRAGDTFYCLSSGSEGFYIHNGTKWKPLKGNDGISPRIGENGNWFIGATDTGVAARGDKGDTGAAGKDGKDYVLTAADKTEIASLVDVVPEAVKAAASAVVDKALGRSDTNVIRFLVCADVHQQNGHDLITKGNREMAYAHGEIVKQIGVDFIANLGDIAWGAYANTSEEVAAQLKAFNTMMGDAVNGETLLYTEGNHDDANYSTVKIDGVAASTDKLTPAAVHALIWGKNKDVVCDPDHPLDGYCYKDFTAQKVRVVCLNTEQGNGDGGVMADYQLKWFAQTALDMSGKEDWSVITLAHHPLDYPTVTLFIDAVNIAEAFINGADFRYTTKDGTTITMDYRNKHCRYVGHFHGHTHGYSADKLRKYASAAADATYVELDAVQIGIPNACYSRNNHNVNHENARFRRYSTETTYHKSDEDGKRTSFNLVTVCLDSKMIYADNYGAGIDRVVSYGDKTLATYTVTRYLTDCTSSVSTSSVTETVGHTEMLTADSGFTMDGAAVTVTMGGEDITASAYQNGVVSVASVTGDIVITATATAIPVAPTYTNQLPIATDTDGRVYDGDGYKTDTYLSSGTPATRSGIVTTGFIPVPDVNGADLGQTVLYFADGGLDNSADTRMASYGADKSYIGNIYGNKIVTVNDPAAGGECIGVFDSDGKLVSLDISEYCHYNKNTGKPIAYIRFCGKAIDGNTIITINEPIE